MRSTRNNASFWLPVILAGAVTTHGGAAAKAPDGHFRVQGDSVEDSATGLVWQRDSSPTTLSWVEAGAYCAGLQLGGKSFRLPTIKELHTLVDESKIMPAIDSAVFPKTEPSVYWSATQLANFPASAWALSFSHGFDNWYSVDTRQRVRCVR